MSSPGLAHQPDPSAGALGLPAWVWMVTAAAAAGVVYVGRDLMLPMLLAAGGAYFLNPFVRRLQERGVARPVAVVGIFAVLTGLVAVVTTLALPTLRVEGQRLVDQAPAFATRIEGAIDGIAREVRASRPMLARLLPPERPPGWLSEMLEVQSDDATAIASQAGALLFLLILSPAFAFFMLRDGPRAMDWVIGRIHPRHIETSVAVWAEIDVIVGRYLRGLLLESAGVGILVGLGLWMLGIPFPLLLAVFAAVVNPLPYIGALATLVLAGLVALTSEQGFGTMGALVALFVVIRLIDDLVLIPATIGGSVHLHPLLVIVAILVAERALGVLGMVFAVPTLTVVKETIRLLLEHRRTLTRAGVLHHAAHGPEHLPL